MKGVVIAFDQAFDHQAAAKIAGGKLDDIQFAQKSAKPKPGQIYRARALRPLKGQGGLVLDIGGENRAYLRNAKGIKEGAYLNVQISTYAEGTKAAPATQKLIFKSRYFIVTPNNPGINLARKLRDESIDRVFLDCADEVMSRAPDHFGLILRSAIKDADFETFENDLSATLTLAMRALNDPTRTPALLVDAPDLKNFAWINWLDGEEAQILDQSGSFDQLGILDQIRALSHPHCDLPNGAHMMIEPTSALVAVDVNTGADMSLAAGLKANINAFKDLPRQLRLRGLGGQITVDLAPYPKKDRRLIEQTIRAAFKQDSVETALVGWTPIGHYELQRKRERLPLSHIFKHRAR